MGWMAPWIFRLLIAAVLITLIYYLIRGRYGPLFFREASPGSPGFVSNMTQKEDYSKLLHQSVSNNDYKLAIRYLFLQSLQSLDSKGHLSIASWKAPYDYLNELSEKDRPAFRQLTDIFEMTWYGGYQADEEAYQKGLQVTRSLQGHE